MKKNLLDNITQTTLTLWNKLYEKTKDYNLAVNGLGEVELLYHYGKVVAKGNRNIQKFIRNIK